MKESVAHNTVHPGVILKDELSSRSLKQKDFASTIGMPASVLNDIINEKRSVTPDIAVLFESALGKPASFWLQLQAERDIEDAKAKAEFQRKEKEISIWKELQDYCNVRLIDKFLPSGLGTSLSDKISSVLSFFGVESVQRLRENFLNNLEPSYFRKSSNFSNDPVNLFTWKHMAYSASKNRANLKSTFDYQNIESLVDELNAVFYLNEKTEERITKTLSKYGIKFIVIPNTQGIHVDGFSFWKEKNPTIVLTFRGKKLDILAFTLLHEICHVYKHLVKGDAEKTCISFDGEKETAEEREADSFANNHLIPAQDWQIFMAKNSMVNAYSMGPRIRSFAEEHKIHPSIVLGRFQYDTGVFDNGRGIERSIN